jgi:hypothetical protein
VPDDGRHPRARDLGHERETRQVAGVRADRRDQGRNLQIVEGRQLEPVDRRGVRGRLGADPDAAGDRRRVAQPAVPTAAAVRPSGTDRRCSTGRT